MGFAIGQTWGHYVSRGKARGLECCGGKIFCNADRFIYVAAPDSVQQSLANSDPNLHETHIAYVESQIPCGDWYVPLAAEYSSGGYFPCKEYWTTSNGRFWAADCNNGSYLCRCWIQMGTGAISNYGGSNVTYAIRAFRKVSY